MNAGRQRLLRGGLGVLTALALVAVLGVAAPAAATKPTASSTHSALLRHAIAATLPHPRAHDLRLDLAGADSTPLATPSADTRNCPEPSASPGLPSGWSHGARGPPTQRLA